MSLSRYLSSIFLFEEDVLHKFALSSPHRYKTYTIPKRNGRGLRTIAHPSRELKVYQRYIVTYLEDQLYSHEAANAYIKGRGIKENAENHSGTKFLLKMDFKDFFPSIVPDMFFSAVLVQGLRLNRRDKSLLRHFLFYKPTKQSWLRLSIGAPSSPFVSNIVMFNFDKILHKKCQSMNINYTRYADDITFSSNIRNILFEVPVIVENLLSHEYGGSVLINSEKTIFSSKRHNRHVTGLTLTNQGGISIGRKRKRIISAMIHKDTLGSLSLKDIEKLEGLISFAKHIEPSFIVRLERKYKKKL